METILEARGINKNVLVGENEFPILKCADLEMKEGEFVAVMGPSGSGKSTLLYNISGMDKISSGSVRFRGREFSDSEAEMAELRLNHMGFIFQDINLLKNLSLIDNIVFPALVSKKADKQAVYEKALQLMKMTGIENLAENNITQASGGQLQRAAICRALMNEPDILFGDEPTGALDSKSTEDIMSILLQVNQQGTTIMLVTHDAAVAARSERVLFMKDGKIADEIILGKYHSDAGDIREREERIIKQNGRS